MAERLVGRVLHNTIELDHPVPALEGKRVRLTVEILADDEPAALRSFREAPPDDRAYGDEERAGVDEARRKGEYITTEELRERLATHHAD